MVVMLILAAIGFAVCVYGISIEQKLKKDASYKAACDISDRASCTKALSSEYSTMLGISKSIWGLIFYAVIFVLAFFHLYMLVFLLSLVACLMTIRFAYTLYFIIKTFCFVCTTTYLVNIGLLIASIYKNFGAQ